MDKEVIIIIIDEIMVVNNHIMAMVLVINVVVVEEEEIMEVVNNVAEIQCIMVVQTNECKPIRSIKNICNKKIDAVSLRVCVCLSE